ncbi:MAG: AbrB/MazE/SpoVT family DNA-binding domain-containing protein [Candidatus Schekmanbacteria bacterium]|nr:AbrB/MazE/SpoVT family DNA-binding domain-containing protein [Candidatus Schekmanbacteria bacterium]
MKVVTISPKFQVIIPTEIRKSLQIKPGGKFQVFQYGNRIELVPAKTVKQMRGFLKGIDTTVKRDGDRI